MNRGNDRKGVFDDAEDRQAFLVALARAKVRFPFDLCGYCLMSNHFHLLIKPEDDVPVGCILHSVLASPTNRFRKRHISVGHIWQGRSKTPLVQGNHHLLAVLRYIEANPLRAGIVEDLRDYPWSSYHVHACGKEDLLVTDLPLLEKLGATPSERRER